MTPQPLRTRDASSLKRRRASSLVACVSLLAVITLHDSLGDASVRRLLCSNLARFAGLYSRRQRVWAT